MSNSTPKMSLNAYQVIPKSSPIKQSDLKIGRNYFIEYKYYIYSMFTDEEIYHNVIFKGKFLRFAERPNYGGPANTVKIYAEFEELEAIADPSSVLRYHPSTPTIFDGNCENRSDSIFIEDHSPSLNAKFAKHGNIVEIQKYIEEKKMEPEENPSICFIGEDYREARKRFKLNH